MNSQLNKRFYAVCNEYNLHGEDLRNAIYGFTNGATSSSKDLSDTAAVAFIQNLQATRPQALPKAKEQKAKWQPPNDEANTARSRLLAIGYGLGWTADQTKQWATAKHDKFNDIPLDELRRKIGKLEQLKAERHTKPSKPK